MKFFWAIGMIWLSGVGHAECLKHGVTPTRIVFEDGAVIDGISRELNTLRYTSHPSRTETATMEALWGIYQVRSTYKGVATGYAWNTDALPPPSDLVPGQKVEHLASSVAASGDVRSHAFSVRLVEKTEISVGGCRYPVLLLETRWGTAGGARSEGLRWYDPDRLVTWATEIRIFKEDGSLDRELGSQAVSAD